MAQSETTSTILSGIQRSLEAGRDPLVVLDLDGTLYNNNVRSLRILQEFAHAHALEHRELMESMDRMSAGDCCYKLADTLAKAGVDDPAVIARAQAFWFDRFFTNEYVLYDLPPPGAREFVAPVRDAGAIPVYLTGRDAPNMLVGTVTALQRDGFPVGTVDTRIILKDDFETADEVYKTSVQDHLASAGDVVAVFDNEPGLCNLFKARFPDSCTVWMKTSWAPNPPPIAHGIPSVPDFTLLLPA